MRQLILEGKSERPVIISERPPVKLLGKVKGINKHTGLVQEL